MRPIPLALAAGLVVAAGSPAQPPDPKGGEAWVRVMATKGTRLIRVAGGPVVQVPPTPSAAPVDFGLFVAKGRPRHGAVAMSDGKRVLYYQEDPDSVPAGAKGAPPRPDGRRNRVVAEDRDGSNPTTVLTGLPWLHGFAPAPGGKAVHCAAERDGKWHLFRVPLDGSPPVHLGRTPGVSPPMFRALADGRVLYQAVTGWNNEVVPSGTRTTPRGTVILTDGATETVLLKEWVGVLPEIAADGSKLAVPRETDAREQVAEVTDLKTGATKQFRVKDFHADWTCRVGMLKFSPDGRALAVSFRLASEYGRGKGPAPGDEAVYHVGVIWLDGRANPTRVVELDPAVVDWKNPLGILGLDWADPPPARP